MAEISADRITNAEALVKWFDGKKGYGFLVGPDGQDIFVHYTVIEGEGFRVLRDGATVNYDATRSDKGWRATRIKRLGPEPAKGQSEDPAVVNVTRRNFSRSPRR